MHQRQNPLGSTSSACYGPSGNSSKIVTSCVQFGEARPANCFPFTRGRDHEASQTACLYMSVPKFLSSSETLVLTRATRRNIPEDAILDSHRRENLKSYMSVPSLRVPYLHKMMLEMFICCFQVQHVSIFAIFMKKNASWSSPGDQ
jgi:hypothetical protein